jgi:hypothetical protein
VGAPRAHQRLLQSSAANRGSLTEQLTLLMSIAPTPRCGHDPTQIKAYHAKQNEVAFATSQRSVRFHRLHAWFSISKDKNSA